MSTSAPTQDHFYLPLGGMDVDIGHMTDQDTMTPSPFPAPSTATPAALSTAALPPTPAGGPLAGTPTPAAAQPAAAARYPHAPPALTSSQYAAHSSSSRSGPLGGREPRISSRGSVDLNGPAAGPDRLVGPSGPANGPGGIMAGPGVKTGTRLIVAAAPAGSALESGVLGGSSDSAQYGGHQDQGVREHKGRRHRHRDGGANGVMGGGLGGEGATQAGGYVPGPLEAAGGGWQQDRGYGGRGY
jgi:hypothetical protein